MKEMNFALGYTVQRFFYRIGDFLRHWYVKSARMYWNSVMSQLEELDYTLAWRVTLKNFMKPMYGDYSIIGYLLGFGFRSARLLVASVIYLAIFTFAFGLYAVWLAIPVFLLAMVFIG